MNQGYIRVAAAAPGIRVADPDYNKEQLLGVMREAAGRKAKLIVFPELCMTAYTCGDLFLQDRLLDRAREALVWLARESADLDILAFIGLPWEMDGKLYNAAAALCGGKVLGIVPKTYIPNYAEYYEARHFTPGSRKTAWIDFMGEQVPVGTDLLFRCRTVPGFTVAAEICEDLWVPCPPSIAHAEEGATVIVNCSASVETVGKDAYRKSLVEGQSGRLVCAYVYASAGEGESSQDLVFSGHNMIVENAVPLAESARFTGETIYADLDLTRLVNERRRMSTYPARQGGSHTIVDFSLKTEPLKLERFIDPAPFVPRQEGERNKRCSEILMIQSLGLKKRLAHTGIRNVVLGISGGLDSTLALLVAAKTFDMMGLPRSQILCVTMPCFGTTDRTYQNACRMTQKIGASLREIDIQKAVLQHFQDIGQDPQNHDAAYENSQARERTQILMDIANQTGGMVIGTGDMSELALGWATYNGDHMSMYGVNASVPKTLVRHLVGWYADNCGDEELRGVLKDVLDTPVSPELLPPDGGVISQKTEDLVGPYELHDFFLYQMLRFGYEPARIFRMAVSAFEGRYEPDEIRRWIFTFYRRFFSQQFKRSCLPDGPKVGSVSLSPRGDLRMPSDACSRIWLAQLEEMQEKESI